MTGDNDLERVRPYRSCYGTHCGRTSHSMGYRSVATSDAIGDSNQCMPYVFLKISTDRHQWETEQVTLTRKVLIQLCSGFRKERAICRLRYLTARLAKALQKSYMTQSIDPVTTAKMVTACNQYERTTWRRIERLLKRR